MHRLVDAKDRDALLDEVGPRIRAMAVSVSSDKIGAELMSKLPKLEIVSTFAVGYDHVDVKWAAEHGVTVTNTPKVLNEEVADTALGLILCTVREFPQAERYLRAGKWLERAYPLTKATLRNRTVGMVGMGAIGQAIARRLDAMKVPVVYHSRRPAAGVSYRTIRSSSTWRATWTSWWSITPGGPETKNLINAEVLKALGPEGILINMARGSVVDEPALIEALKDKTIMSAGLDVYRARARGAGGADGDGERRAVPASRFGVGLYPHADGPARGRQSRRLGGRRSRRSRRCRKRHGRRKARAPA